MDFTVYVFDCGPASMTPALLHLCLRESPKNSLCTQIHTPLSSGCERFREIKRILKKASSMCLFIEIILIVNIFHV